MDTKTLKKEISVEELFEYLDTDAVKACEKCENYNCNYTCPAFDFEAKEFLNQYQSIILYGKRFETEKEVLDLKFSKELIDHFAKEYCRTMIKETNDNLLKLEEIIHDSNALLVSRCEICETCAKMENMPCPYPNAAHYSLQSLGFSVEKILKEEFDEKLVFSSDGRLAKHYIFLGGILKSK